MPSNTDAQEKAANQESGAKLRTMRQSKGMSQEDVSLSANIYQSILSKAERIGPQSLSWRKLVEAAKRARLRGGNQLSTKRLTRPSMKAVGAMLLTFDARHDARRG